MDNPEAFAADRASKGGKSRMAKLSPEERKQLARNAAEKRWRKPRPKVGIIALVDEATGYQAQRPLDELQLKLKLLLAKEMRKWENTFPDDLWIYFQWLTEQYGLKKLIEHIWKVIGVASTCANMDELESRMEELYGKKAGFQFELKTNCTTTVVGEIKR